MTSTTTRDRETRTTTHLAAEMERTIHTLETSRTTCPQAIATKTLVAIELRRLQRIAMGDIGEKTKEIEAPEPIDIPVPDREPERAPEPIPS